MVTWTAHDIGGTNNKNGTATYWGDIIFHAQTLVVVSLSLTPCEGPTLQKQRVITKQQKSRNRNDKISLVYTLFSAIE